MDLYDFHELLRMGITFVTSILLPWKEMPFSRGKNENGTVASPEKYWSRGYKSLFMLNSAEHVILNACKYKI